MWTSAVIDSRELQVGSWCQRYATSPGPREAAALLTHEKFDPNRGLPRTPGVGARLELGGDRRSDDAPRRRLGPALEPSSPPEGRRRLLMGRLAGVLFLASSGLMLIALPLSPADAGTVGTVGGAAGGGAGGGFRGARA